MTRQTELPDGLAVEVIDGFWPEHGALFDASLEQLAWDDRMRARKTASCGVAYNYSQMTYPDAPVPALLAPVIASVEAVVGHTITNCLANFYVDGTSTMGFHSDSGEAVVPGTTTSILSLGAPRTLSFRRKSDRSTEWPIDLSSGSLLVMQASVQDDWQHGLHATPEAGPRISLTFRHLVHAP